VGAVYHHVQGQAALQSAVVEHVLAAVPTPSALDGTPRERIVQTLRAMQEVLEANPGLTASVIAAAPDLPIARRLRRDVRATFRDAGLSPADARRAYVALEWLWLGSRVVAGRHSYDATTFHRALDALLDGLLDK